VTAEIVVVEAVKEMMDAGEDEEVDVIGMERKQMIVDVLVFPLLSPKQKKKRKNGKDKK